MIKCYCGSQLDFEICCQPYINGIKKAPTAEALMRSRYSAFATHKADYLIETTHFSTRKHHIKEDILEWAVSNQWIKLLVMKATINSVTFKAFYIDSELQSQIHQEHSIFKLEDGSWYYVDGTFH
ncbi:YchJ family protein [Flavobacterium sp. W1B]|uniref:YchJ family protein n=1 Tax=Flavobacterium sp. W1B TaxID=3394146 RepID=UPI0039BC83D1